MYFALVALALVAIAIGTVWLRGVLRDYESAQPKYVAQDVAKLFENADYETIYNVDTSAEQFRGGDETLYLDNLKQLTAGKRVEWTPAFSANKNERKYNVNLDGERLARALKECKAFIWGNAAYSIPFCVCRDLFHLPNNASLFERMLAEAGCEIPDGTINNAMSRNPWMRLHAGKWEQQGVMERVLRLRDKFIQEMQKE